MHVRLRLTLCTVLLLVGGCSPASEETSPQPASDIEVETPGAQLPDDPLEIPVPGLYELDDGRLRAVGTLARIDLEGGFWALVEPSADEAESGSSASTILAVIANPEEVMTELADLEGSYVAATGTPFDGVSIRMAGPELVVTTIEYLADSLESTTGITP